MAKSSRRQSRTTARATRRRTAAPAQAQTGQTEAGGEDERARKTILEQTLRRLIFRTFGHQRFTQDSPLLPDVWLNYAKADEDVPLDLILTPRAGHTPGAIATLLESRLSRYHSGDRQAVRERALIAYSRSSVVAKLTFAELMRIVVPMTSWWCSLPEDYRSFDAVDDRLADLRHERVQFKKIVNTTGKWEYFRFIVLAGFIHGWRRLGDPEERENLAEILQTDSSDFSAVHPIVEGFLRLLKSFKDPPDGAATAQIWSISLNRRSHLALYESRPAIKADAAQNVFEISTQGLAWAVVDCGIDAAHPAFLDRDPAKKHPIPAKGREIPLAQSRIQRTFDFTFLRTLLALEQHKYTTAGGREISLKPQQREEMRDLRRRISLGREIDWDLILPLLEVPHDATYEKPTHDHGTHVAGILAGHWPEAESEEGDDLIGICPDLRLYDFRVFDNTGSTEEFIMMAALQVVAHLNRFRDHPVIHGVNMSLSIRHEVMSYACGRTPICEECTRLVGDGVVVVAAAGNQGFNEALETGGGQFGSYRVASITDPGNAEAVITVGSTHRGQPHTYGVSYFSSRGPTGDGRRKPDLVAPGEKITAPIPNVGAKRMDGTSMAAPHVSGAAALLMARHRELVGRPGMIKQILCKSATDLGREAHFQGAGMLDILRALQSV
jgi:serine protease AprX